jgi:hypothetical protein
VGPTDALAYRLAASEFEWFGLETAESEAVVAEARVKFLGFWNRIDLQSRHVVSRIAWEIIIIRFGGNALLAALRLLGDS